MSLRNHHWINLSGDSVTGRPPPRLVVMNGIQPTDEQLSGAAYHYQDMTRAGQTSIIPYRVEERSLPDGTRIRLVSNYGRDTVMVWPVDTKGKVRILDQGIYITLQEVEFDADGPEWVKTRDSLVPATRLRSNKPAVPWSESNVDTGALLVVIDGDNLLNESSYREGQVRFFRAPTRTGMGLAIPDRHLSKSRPVPWLIPATNQLVLFNRMVDLSATLSPIDDETTVDFFTVGFRPKKLPFLSDDEVKGVGFVVKMKTTGGQHVATLYAFKVDGASEQPLVNLASSSIADSESWAQFGYEFKATHGNGVTTLTTDGTLYPGEVTSSFKATIAADPITGNLDITGEITLNVKPPLVTPSVAPPSIVETFEMTFREVTNATFGRWVPDIKRTLTVSQSFLGEYQQDPWTEEASYAPGRTITVEREKWTIGEVDGDLVNIAIPTHEKGKITGAGPNAEDVINAEFTSTLWPAFPEPAPVVSAPGNEGTAADTNVTRSGYSSWERYRVGTFKQYSFSVTVSGSTGALSASDFSYALRVYGFENPIPIISNLAELFPGGVAASQSLNASTIKIGSTGTRILFDAFVQDGVLLYATPFPQLQTYYPPYYLTAPDPAPDNVNVPDVKGGYALADYVSAFKVNPSLLVTWGVELISIMNSIGAQTDLFGTIPSGTGWTTSTFRNRANGIIENWFPKVYHDPRNSTFIVQGAFVGQEEAIPDIKCAGALRLFVGNRFGATPLEPLINDWLKDIKYASEADQEAYGDLVYEPGDLMIDWGDDIPWKYSPLV